MFAFPPHSRVCFHHTRVFCRVCGLTRTAHAGNEFIQLIVFVLMVDTADFAMDCSNYGEKSKPGGIFAFCVSLCRS